MTTPPTLFFSPTDYNLEAFSDDFVQPGDTCVWGTKTYTVRDVAPIAPDAVVIAAKMPALRCSASAGAGAGSEFREEPFMS